MREKEIGTTGLPLHGSKSKEDSQTSEPDDPRAGQRPGWAARTQRGLGYAECDACASQQAANAEPESTTWRKGHLFPRSVTQTSPQLLLWLGMVLGPGIWGEVKARFLHGRV